MRILKVVLLVCFSGIAASAQQPSEIVPADAKLDTLWNDGAFTEGVAVAADGRVYFSDIPGAGKKGRILRFDPTSGSTSVFCPDSGKSNGLMFDRRGRLLAACGANDGVRAICEITPRARIKPLLADFHGKRFNSPNDLVIHPNGAIFFSDPRYVGHEPRELDHESVYRIDQSGKVARLKTGITRPNGVHVSPDGRTLYVAETDGGGPGRKKRMTLNAFPLQADGSLGPRRVLRDFGTEDGVDGMTLDARGNIYAAVRTASRPGIVVFDPQGKELASIRTPALPTNCCFGRDREGRVLYITAGKGLYRIRLGIPGFHTTVPRAKNSKPSSGN